MPSLSRQKIKNNSLQRIHFSKVDKVMVGLMEKFEVKKWKRPTEDHFEYLAHTILYQQLSTKAAGTISKRFADLFNPSLVLPSEGEGMTRAFPTPEKILKIPDETLRSVGISWNKVRYIKDLAEKVLKKEIDLNNLHKLSDEEVVLELVKVKGIGRWTAEMFLMSALGRPDIFSLGDLGLRTAIKKAYGFKKIPSDRTIIRLSNKWKPYRTLACRLLWASLDNEPKV